MLSEQSTWADFHSHSSFSDGTLTPTELVRMAAKLGIGTFALTDHDTIAGLPEAEEEAKKHGIDFVSGVEVSTTYPNGTLHILGYGFDPEASFFKKELQFYQESRKSRNQEMIEKLQKLGLDITVEEVIQKAEKSDSIGRPHIAAVLLEKGIVPNIRSCFELYLGETGKAYISRDFYPSDKVIRMIHEAGGKAFVAHPVHLHLDEEELTTYLKNLKDEGLDGLEVYSSAHNRKMVNRFRKIATSIGLLISGGSDYHGKLKSQVRLGVCHEGVRIRKEWISDYFFHG